MNKKTKPKPNPPKPPKPNNKTNNLAKLLLSLYSFLPLSNCISEQKPVSFIQIPRNVDSILCLPLKEEFIIKWTSLHCPCEHAGKQKKSDHTKDFRLKMNLTNIEGCKVFLIPQREGDEMQNLKKIMCIRRTVLYSNTHF